MAYKQQKFISHSSEGWDSKIEVLADSVFSEGPLPTSWFINGWLLTVFSHGERGKGTLFVFLIRALISFMPSWPNQLPNAPPTNTISLGLKFELWRDTNIQSIADVLFSQRWISRLFTGAYSESHVGRGCMFGYVEVGGNFLISVVRLSLNPLFSIQGTLSQLCLTFLILCLFGPFSLIKCREESSLF